MREIKFRAYLKNHNKTVNVDAIDFIEEEITVIDQFGNDYYFRFDEIALIQYTGLKDKNGKGIYEGDILKYRVWPTYRHVIKPVIFHKGKYIVRADGENEWGDSLWDCTVAGCEVIGNIYGNPELLEQTNAN